MKTKQEAVRGQAASPKLDATATVRVPVQSTAEPGISSAAGGEYRGCDDEKRGLGNPEHVKQRLQAAVQAYYETKTELRVQPLYPWVLVYVLPKQQKFGSLYLPEKQSKPLFEGVVIETWRPRPSRTSELKPGDHVFFPHWAGVPTGWLDEGEYRFVKEHTTYNPPDLIVGGLQFEQETVLERLANTIEELGATVDWADPNAVYVLARRISDGFYVVPRNTGAKTISGA